ncbi:MAG: pyruvate, phosphate dikinase, partial [candidate division WOR-3 bacterium]
NNAQGEDIVAGIRTPKPLEWLEHEQPEVYAQLVTLFRKLENHYRDVQDVEFTVENGRLWILQCRTAKRTPRAAVRIACDMVREEMIAPAEAVMRVSPEAVGVLLHKSIDPEEKYEPAAKGIAASPGAAMGEIVLSSSRAVELASSGRHVILVRQQTSADDVAGMASAEGFLTATGGMTSHAAVVARGMGKPCVVGCAALHIDAAAKRITLGERTLTEGDVITINGTTGEVIVGKVKMVDAELTGELKTVLGWADKFRRLGVRANADTPADAQLARSFGAVGIGLCRTEHMFFGPDRIGTMQEMILAEDESGRRRALAKLLPMQRADFLGIFRAMDGFPVTIRTLDPPLHEFLPKDQSGLEALAERLGITVQRVQQTITRLKEENPMLGFRGCRLGIAHPEITEMQARAIFEAACQAKTEGIKVMPEVMIPLVSTPQELRHQREVVVRTASQVFERTGAKVSYLVGTMIEVPRAALVADEVAEFADFFSFGTNDLTQMTFGFSRDDAGKFLHLYQSTGIVERNPFETLDIDGVGQLIRMTVKLARRKKPGLKIGICGEHGGDPASVEFCHQTGLDYVSCSPFRVPVARLAAAQAAIRDEQSQQRRSEQRKRRTVPKVQSGGGEQ